ncbi:MULTISPECIES: ATP-binding protein [Streptomyces]|uniref:histidine kinase n=1 Tax=Streptomyces lienomycini TaxID=284035 RepID=A0ABV9X3A8_9ACTN|nr:ATP-binding protein [Streptomyces lienomycini]
MTAPARPGDRSAPRSLAAVALPCAVVAALAVGGAVAAAPSSVRLPLGLCASAAAILLCAAVTVAVHSVRTVRATRRLLEAARTDADGLARERGRLAERARQEQQRLQAEADAERSRVAAEAEREVAAAVAAFAREREQLAAGLEQERARAAESRAEEAARLTDETARLRVRLEKATAERAAAVSATANAAGRMQALATGMLADLRAMEERHNDEDVLADLLHLDHRTAQAGRLADSVAVLTGARSGRRWARPIGMESILRGAMGRIAGYQRVRVHSASDTAVAGHAAEGVMHALAELLDNAANFSPPTAEVHVYVEEVPAGVIVSVEDSGLVMGEVQLRRAQQAVAGETAGLGGLTGTRLGLAVVGRLSAKYGLKVSFRPSARGGTGVLMLVPQDLLSGPAAPRASVPALSAAPDGPPRTPAAPAAEPAPAPVPADFEPLPVHDLADRERTGDPDRPAAPDEPSTELPKRRRGRTLAAAERARAATRADAEPRTTSPADDAKARAARFSSFRQAVRTTTGTGTTPGAGPAPDGAPRTEPAAPEPAETAADHPSHSSAHPEGDTTS